MRDEKRFAALIIPSILLVFIILCYNILQENVVPEIGSYIKRRLYYEKVISQKDLSLHKGEYWKRIEEQ